jgi:hypothetical protein
MRLIDRLNHPNIVRILEEAVTGAHSTWPWEYLEGQNLADG